MIGVNRRETGTGGIPDYPDSSPVIQREIGITVIAAAAQVSGEEENGTGGCEPGDKQITTSCLPRLIGVYCRKVA